VDGFPSATRTVLKDRLGHIFGGYINLLAIVDIGNVATRNRIGNGPLDLTFKAPDKTLAVYRTLVFPVQSSVNYLCHEPPRQEALRTRKYHSDNSLTCLPV
jgi:hypothetical protein